MKRWMTLGLVAIGLGCDAQTGDQYRGEPLLTMSGSVQLALEVDNQDQLMPALAFRGQDGDSRMFVVDADVQGHFPAEFTLNVYEPPPEGAIQTLEAHYEQRPRVAIGYITAVTPETPRTFRYGTSESSFGSGCAVDAEGGTPPCPTTHQWCNSDQTACYTEVVTCPASDSPPEDCTVVADGDPALKNDQFDELSGLSENYMVLWLEEPAPPRSWIAYAVGKRDEGLAQGYHLIELTEQDESPEHDACIRRADSLAAERLNERLGTHYTGLELDEYCVNSAGDCDEDATYAAYLRLRVEAEVELDCGPDDLLITHIDDPASERISVHIGDDLKGF